MSIIVDGTGLYSLDFSPAAGCFLTAGLVYPDFHMGKFLSNTSALKCRIEYRGMHTSEFEVLVKTSRMKRRQSDILGSWSGISSTPEIYFWDSPQLSVSDEAMSLC